MSKEIFFKGGRFSGPLSIGLSRQILIPIDPRSILSLQYSLFLGDGPQKLLTGNPGVSGGEGFEDFVLA